MPAAGRLLLSGENNGDSSTPGSVGPRAIDPWLIWHLQQLGEAADRSAELSGAERAVEATSEKMGFLLQRPGPDWPDEIPVAPYYRQQNLEFGTMSLSPSAAQAMNERVPELRVACPVMPQLTEFAVDSGELPIHDGPSGSGAGVVIGFVDNGCAFGHPNFLIQPSAADAPSTRVVRLWDQSPLAEQRNEPWEREGTHFGYGAELTNAKMNEILRRQLEDGLPAREMYRRIMYPMQELIHGIFRDSDFTHGTHLMDIAAGSGGIAPKADIVFVQLPRYAIRENTAQASARHILDGAAYIFAHAEETGQPAVVNISYNAFTGPHDGSSLLERGLDELISRRNDRYIVMSAGNGAMSGCHTSGTIEPKQTIAIGWRASLGDRTQNFLEAWYSGDVALKARMIRPGGGDCTPPVDAGEYAPIDIDHDSVGMLIHASRFENQRQGQILVALGPTEDPKDGTSRPCAPAGLWKIELSNPSEVRVNYHAWIERDDRGTSATAEQSRFEDTVKDCTIGGACTGTRTIVVGACNPDYGTRLAFSGLGPTLNSAKPNKPNIYAPGSLRAAQALSARPVRLVGTSVSAAVISGLAAYGLGPHRHHRGQPAMDIVAGLLARADADQSLPAGIEPVACIDLRKLLEAIVDEFVDHASDPGP